MKLFISGKTVSFSVKSMPPRVQKLKKFLDDSKDGELFSTVQLSRLTGRDFHNIKNEGDLFLPEYSHKVGTTRYWGKPVTIKQLIKETKNGR